MVHMNREGKKGERGLFKHQKRVKFQQGSYSMDLHLYTIHRDLWGDELFYSREVD